MVQGENKKSFRLYIQRRKQASTVPLCFTKKMAPLFIRYKHTLLLYRAYPLKSTMISIQYSEMHFGLLSTKNPHSLGILSLKLSW